MRAMRIVVVGLALGCSVALPACEGRPSSAQVVRCAYCGMRIDPGSPWRAGLFDRSGRERLFDAPKCMLGFRFSDAGEGAREAWVIEYYTGQRRPAEALFYVVGSDVQGPMGRDFVPVEGRERAQRFRADHHGDRVLAWSEIDAATVQSLFRP